MREESLSGNRRNFSGLTEELIRKIAEEGSRPALLLHSCCAPCSSYVLEYLSGHFDLTVYYFNPNISPAEEYRRRAQEQQRLADMFHVPCMIEEYEHATFLTAARGLELAPEGGKRCEACFALRLEQTARFAKEHGFSLFATTLSISPHKDANKINEIGERIAQEAGVSWLFADFKKRGGYQRSIELSKRFSLYRQNYCGCEFALQQNQAEKGQPILGGEPI